MRLLLDPHTFIWMTTSAGRLSEPARLALADPDNDRLHSTASGWEMAIKAGPGKLDLKPSVAEFVARAMRDGQITELPVRLSHALAVAGLPAHHRDPFDRLLVAQARAESLTLVTADPLLRQYDVHTLW